jgi:hypothetical protein
MDVQENGNLGVLKYKDRWYEKTDIVIKYWDLKPQVSFSPERLLEHIRNKGRLRYRMAEGGLGCRYWVYVNSFLCDDIR